MSNGPFVWSLRDRRRLVESATVTYFDKDNQAGSLTVQSVGAHPSDRRFDYVFDKFGGNIPLVMCDPKTVKMPKGWQDTWPFPWKDSDIDRLKEGAQVRHHGDGVTVLTVRDTGAWNQPENDWVVDVHPWGKSVYLGDCDPATIVDAPQKKFKWDARQRSQLALAQHVEVPGVGRVGVSTVDFSAFAQRWVLFTTDGARIDLEDVDPSTIGPRHDDRSAPSIEVYRALDRLDLLFSTKPPDFSVVSEEDRAAWKLVSNLLRK